MTETLFYAEMCARFLAISAIVHGIEFLQLSKVTADNGVWRWNDLEREFGSAGSILRFFLSHRGFQLLNIARLILAATVLIVPTAFGVGALFLFQLFTMLRWLGAFNGGSDFMALLVLLFTTLALSLDGVGAKACLWYIGIQVSISYLRAGWFKITNVDWRSGRALRDFMRSPIYATKRFSTKIANSTTLCRAGAWAVMIFEVSFPLGLFNSNLAIVYLIAGFLFHLGNAYFFGLNRFIWAWLAGYPAVFYFSLWRSQV